MISGKRLPPYDASCSVQPVVRTATICLLRAMCLCVPGYRKIVGKSLLGAIDDTTLALIADRVPNLIFGLDGKVYGCSFKKGFISWFIIDAFC